IGAGPILLKDGKAALNPVKEGFTDTTSFQMPVARSAVGITEDGTILLVGNVKCTAEEMSAVMLELGAEQAIAMDSGSSSGLYSVAEDAVAAPAKAISNALIFK
ncbi:MAG: phosphodiester glycosidase family protein, partial [Peptococcaceae bacterium]|nr:phosphodiester glycosidase family protein [Peptococcaceae bacterium]